MSIMEKLNAFKEEHPTLTKVIGVATGGIIIAGGVAVAKKIAGKHKMTEEEADKLIEEAEDEANEETEEEPSEEEE